MSDSVSPRLAAESPTAPRWRRLAVWVMALLGIATLAAVQPSPRAEPLPWVGTLDS